MNENNNYVSPQVEVIEIEIEDAVLQGSTGNTLDPFTDGGINLGGN